MIIIGSELGLKTCQLIDKYSKSLCCLLVLSAILGAIMGTSVATWQHPVETAQVLMGLVTYDHSSLAYAYHVSLFSLLNYLGWFFLAVTNSEASSSILISALLGAVATQTVAMIVFLVLRNVYLAILVTFLLGLVNFFGSGISYPIFFMGTEHAYGRAGLFFALYALLILAFSNYKVGFFLSGLAIGVHPAWGMWLAGILFLVLLVQYIKFKYLINKENIASYLAGLALVLLIFAWQKIHYPINFESSGVNTDSAHDIFLNYIRYWDYHRQKFDNLKVLWSGFFYAFVTLCLAVFWGGYKQKESVNGEALFFSIIIVSTVLAIPFVFIPSWFDPSIFPAFFVTLMPGRFINLSIFLCTPLLIATLLSYKSRYHKTYCLAAILIFFAVVSTQYSIKFAVSLIGCTAGLIWIAHYIYTGRKVCAIHYGVAMLYFYLLSRVQYGHKRATLFAIFVLLFIWAGEWFYKRANLRTNIYSHVKTCLSVLIVFLVSFSPIYLTYKFYMVKNSNFFQIEILPNINGSILTTMDRYMVQAETRVSSITPHIDGYSYIGQDSILLNLDQYTSDLFGISIAKPPPPNLTLHQSVFSTIDYKSLWQSRSCEEWSLLSKKYHFGLILVPADMHLKLEKMDDDPVWGKYRPKCKSSS